MTSELDLFAVLRFLDQNNMDLYSEIQQDPTMLVEFNKMVGWLLPRWMSGSTVNSEHRLLIKNFNEFANVGWFAFSKHPELQAKLLACCGTGRPTKHKFTRSEKGAELHEIRDLLETKYDDISDEEIQMWCRLNDERNMVDFAGRCGYQQDAIKKLKKVYVKAREGIL